MQKKENPLIAKIIEENVANIDQWKDKHKTIKAVVVTSNLLKKDFAYIIAKPTSVVMSAVQSYEHQGKLEKVDETLVKNCVKAGDVDVFTEDLDIKNAVYNKIFDLFERLEVEEKEL